MLCYWLKEQSRETWERIGFVRCGKHLKIFETTITQNILYNCAKFNFRNQKIVLFEAVDEKRNGNDIELYVCIKNRFIFFPVQAKLLYKSLKYTKMNHNGQINSLIKYARTRGGIPLYLLYNFIDFQNLKKLNIAKTNSYCGEYLDIEQYGCSLVNAFEIFKNFYRHKKCKLKIPSFSDLYPEIVFPWMILGCCKMGINKLIGNYKYKIYTKINYDGWEKIATKNLHEDNREKRRFAKNDKIKNEFLPGYRLVING